MDTSEVQGDNDNHLEWFEFSDIITPFKGIRVKRAKGVIYCIKNRINQKRYVGRTKDYYHARLRGHYNDSVNKNSEFIIHDAIRKYGAENFLTCVLEENLDNTLLNDREVYWVSKLETFVEDYPDKGYNMTRGGDGTDGYTVKQSTRDTISRKKKGVPMPEHQK